MVKILMVDDDRAHLRSLQQVFTEKGYEVVLAHTAREGLRTALTARPNLIILDVNMETDVAGFEFVYQLRSRRSNSRYLAIRDTPIILLTAISQNTNWRFSLNDKESYLPGPYEFLSKPVNLDELLIKTKQLVG